ncbi:MAG: hypothetical protein QE487_06680 [Fluviicola sp.]|nr:hypothetical protein [Fluviicola sp.]
MIRTSSPTIIDLDLHKNQELTVDSERRDFVLENSSFLINPTRLGDIQLDIKFESGSKPGGLFIYYFQHSRLQVQPIDSPFKNGDTLELTVTESGFWRDNPLYVDRIGILGRGTGTCKLQVDVFRIF